MRVVAWLVVCATSFVGAGNETQRARTWMTMGIVVVFALYCGGLWLLTEVVGLE